MKTIKCSRCNQEVERTGKSQKYCKDCSKKSIRESIDRSRAKKGVKVGIGSGHLQGKRESHHSFKTGIGIFKKIKLESTSDYRCERCLKDLEEEIRHKRKTWCVHHKDRNRYNNTLANLELLCKNCHQKEHKCHLNFHKTKI